MVLHTLDAIASLDTVGSWIWTQLDPVLMAQYHPQLVFSTLDFWRTSSFLLCPPKSYIEIQPATSAVTMAVGAWTRCCQHVCGTDRNICSQAARLRKLTCCLDKWLNHDVSSILEGLGISVNLQFTQHNLCEYMQQHHRTDPASKKWESTSAQRHQMKLHQMVLCGIFGTRRPHFFLPHCGARGSRDLETFSWQEPLFSCSYFQTQQAVYHLVEQNLQKNFAIAWIEVQGGGIRFLPR